jgi:hypothetical protein
MLVTTVLARTWSVSVVSPARLGGGRAKGVLEVRAGSLLRKDREPPSDAEEWRRFFVTDSSWTNFRAGPEFFDTSAYM